MARSLLFIIVIALSTLSIQAASVDQSVLLTQSYLNQLESWLGQGPIGLTRIFYKQSGDGLNSNNFHSAVDGKGRTITVLRISNLSNQIVGGYNPISWDTHGHYHTAVNTSAFLFNLTNSAVFYKNTNNMNYETYNASNYGPTFGGGHDLYVDSTLQSGYGYASYSYGSYQWSNMNLTPGYASYTYDRMEVFTIGVEIVPEPANILFFGLVFVVSFLLRKKSGM